MHPAQCRHIVRQRGFEKVTVDQLAQELTPRGRVAVPDRRDACAQRAVALSPDASRSRCSVKAELLKSIKEALQQK